MGDKKRKNLDAIFSLYSCGVVTARDTWVYNFNRDQVKENMNNMIQFYNQELKQLKDKKLDTKNIDGFINRNEKKIKWSNTLKSYFLRKKKGEFRESKIVEASYRPFTKAHLYFDSMFNDRVSQNQGIFTKENIENRVICVSGIGAKTFSVLMTDNIPDFGYIIY